MRHIDWRGIAQRVQDGEKLTAIANELRLDRKTIRVHLFTKVGVVPRLAERLHGAPIPETEICQEYEAGAAISAIAKRHHASPDRIAIILRQNGVAIRAAKDRLPRLSKITSDDALRQDWYAGLSVAEIAAKYGVTYCTVRRRARRIGLRRLGLVRVDAERARALAMRGWRNADIAAEMGCSVAALHWAWSNNPPINRPRHGTRANPTTPMDVLRALAETRGWVRHAALRARFNMSQKTLAGRIEALRDDGAWIEAGPLGYSYVPAKSAVEHVNKVREALHVQR